MALALLLAAAVGCSSGPADYCDDLEDWTSLEELNAAITAGDKEAAEEQVVLLEELAAAAPDEISEDMNEIAATTRDVVTLGLAGAGSSADELERERVNRRLGSVVEHTTAVAAWAETECGLRLD